MTNFAIWCDTTDVTANPAQGSLHIVTTDMARVGIGIDAVAGALPSHYIPAEELAQAFSDLNQSQYASYIAKEMPSRLTLKSGDLGEVMGMAYLEERTDWSISVRKLRYSPTRRMPMHGDDLLAFKIDRNDNFHVLKGEAKSRATLATHVIQDARSKLDEFDGCPDPATINFCRRMLIGEGRVVESERIFKEQWKIGITPNKVTHMIFTFTGNAPEGFLNADLGGPLNVAARTHVGLRIENHQDFLKAVYDKVLADAES